MKGRVRCLPAASAPLLTWGPACAAEELALRRGIKQPQHSNGCPLMLTWCPAALQRSPPLRRGSKVAPRPAAKEAPQKDPALAVAFEKGVEDPSQPAQEASPDLLDFDGLGVSEGAPAAGGPQVGILSWGHLTAVLDLGGQGTRLRQEGSKCPSAQVAAPYKPENFAKDLGARLGRELAVSFYSVLHWLQTPCATLLPVRRPESQGKVQPNCEAHWSVCCSRQSSHLDCQCRLQ